MPRVCLCWWSYRKQRSGHLIFSTQTIFSIVIIINTGALYAAPLKLVTWPEDITKSVIMSHHHVHCVDRRRCHHHHHDHDSLQQGWEEDSDSGQGGSGGGVSGHGTLTTVRSRCRSCWPDWIGWLDSGAETNENLIIDTLLLQQLLIIWFEGVLRLMMKETDKNVGSGLTAFTASILNRTRHIKTPLQELWQKMYLEGRWWRDGNGNWDVH